MCSGPRPSGEHLNRLEKSSKVTACGSLRIITTLEFFEHHFAKSGHEDLLMTRQLTSAVRHKLLRSPHAKRPPRGRLRSSRLVERDFRIAPGSRTNRQSYSI